MSNRKPDFEVQTVSAGGSVYTEDFPAPDRVAFQFQVPPPTDVVDVLADGLQVVAAPGQYLHDRLRRAVDGQADLLNLRWREPVCRPRTAPCVAGDV